MIIKTIFKKIEVHPFFYVVSFFAFLTGNFKTFTLFISMLLFHELGHIIAAYYFKWNIEKVSIYPFGALTVLQDSFNKPIKEEFVITLLGPIFQILFYIFLKPYFDITSMHYGLLLFNLLPIVPLDGSKLGLLIYQRFFSYYSSFYYELIVSSFFFLILLLKGTYSLFFFLILITLVIEILTHFKERKIRFQKFLLERLLYTFHFKRRKFLKSGNVKQMLRDTNHLFWYQNHYITEKCYLQKMFDFKRKRW